MESPDCWGCVRLALPKRPTEALGRALPNQTQQTDLEWKAGNGFLKMLF